jgi:hypothetical protein
LQTAEVSRAHARWWIDPEAQELVEPLLERITAPLAHLAVDARWSRGAVLRTALALLAERAEIPEGDVAALQRHMARWPTRELAPRTWEADEQEMALQQRLGGDLGLRTADVQALAVRYLAEHYGLDVPDWRTDGPPQQA